MIESSIRGRVRHLALNRPDKRNALNAELCQTLVDAFDEAEQDPGTGSILLTGNGPAFCAGMDLQEVPPPGLEALHERLFSTIARIRKPLVAAVHGAALAGGTGLAANCHIAIAAPDARFGLTEIRVGLWPVLVYRAIALAVGERRATELSLTGRVFESAEALRLGLVTEIAEDPLQRARAIAATLAEYSPAALSAGLRYANDIRGESWAGAGEIGAAVRQRLMAHPDFKEGVAAFFEKRQPVWPSLAGNRLSGNSLY